LSFQLLYSRAFRWLLVLLRLGPHHSGVIVDSEYVKVWLGWAFSIQFPRDVVQRVARTGDVWWAIGAHFTPSGRWIVNGSPRNIVNLVLAMPCQAKSVGIPVTVRSLSVSVVDVNRLIQLLQVPARQR